MTDDAERRAREVENLRAVYQSLRPGAASPPARSRAGRNVAAGTVGGGLLFVLGQAKFVGLLVGALEWKTLAPMLLSIGAYAIPGGDALPSRQRATIALAYAALVIALVATLPLHD